MAIKKKIDRENLRGMGDRTVRLWVMLFITCMIFAFWLISFDEMIKAFIGIAIINGWFFTILYLHLQGKILFLDDLEAMEAEVAEEEAASEKEKSDEGSETGMDGNTCDPQKGAC